jgi:hypothetical protein
MEDSFERDQLESLLQRLGEVLEAGGTSAAIVIVGGAALNLLGAISRATVDIDVIATGVRSRHTTDLLALHPTAGELEAAAEWVRRQDAGPEFPSLVAEVIAHVAARTQ